MSLWSSSAGSSGEVESDPPAVDCTNLSVTTIRPLEKTDHVKIIDPTPTDMLMLDSFVPVFFAYRFAENPNVAEYKQLVTRIKEGLRKVLVPFFPWAGRWIQDPEGAGRQLLCNDKGVPFVEAYVDQNLDSVVGLSAEFQPVVELQGYSALGMNAMQLRQPMLPDGLPCAFVQVTRFKCGGLVVAATFNHMLGDGKSFFDFMKAWSDFSRINKTNMICDHNRAAAGTLLNNDPPATSKTVTDVAPPEWEVKSYEVSASVIAFLKSQVKKSAVRAYVSTMDCIFAHMWKSLSTISSSARGKEIGMVNAVEGRTRFFDPPLPNLLGNVVVSMRAPSISTHELLKMPLSVIASKIRGKMISTTVQDRWLSPERAVEALDAFRNDNVWAWGQTCWNSFPIYKIDFGFGNPFFSPGLNNKFSWNYMLGMSYVGPPTPGISSSAAFLVIRSKPDLLASLERHPDFLQLFLPRKKVESQLHRQQLQRRRGRSKRLREG